MTVPFAPLRSPSTFGLRQKQGRLETEALPFPRAFMRWIGF